MKLRSKFLVVAAPLMAAALAACESRTFLPSVKSPGVFAATPETAPGFARTAPAEEPYGGWKPEPYDQKDCANVPPSFVSWCGYLNQPDPVAAREKLAAPHGDPEMAYRNVVRAYLQPSAIAQYAPRGENYTFGDNKCKTLVMIYDAPPSHPPEAAWVQPYAAQFNMSVEVREIACDAPPGENEYSTVAQFFRARGSQWVPGGPWDGKSARITRKPDYHGIDDAEDEFGREAYWILKERQKNYLGTDVVLKEQIEQKNQRQLSQAHVLEVK